MALTYGKDGAMGLVRCCCDPVVSNGDFYGPKGVSGPAVLMPDDSKLALRSRVLCSGGSRSRPPELPTHCHYHKQLHDYS